MMHLVYDFYNNNNNKIVGLFYTQAQHVCVKIDAQYEG